MSEQLYAHKIDLIDASTALLMVQLFNMPARSVGGPPSANGPPSVGGPP
jgi:hypothetical protein